MRIDLRIFGYRTFAVRESDALLFLEECRRAGFTPKAPYRDEKTEEIRFTVPLFEYKKVRGLRVPIRAVRSGGTPVLARRLFSRPGLFFGVFAALALLICSHLFLWDVRVSGCESLTSDEVESALAEAGICRGAFLPRLSEDRAVCAVREQNERIGYLSINRRGTVAFVQVREAKTERAKGETSPANLVASTDGVVTLPMVYAGECLVREGDAVSAGQILVSGITESERGGRKMTRAAGEILAKTTHTYRVFVPFCYEEKEYLGNGKASREIAFFNKTIKLYKNISENDENCDIIKEKKQASFLSVRLPITLSRVRQMPYVLVLRERSEREAWQIAKEETAALLADMSGCTVLEKTVTREISEDGVTLITTLIAEENIAKTAEIGTK